MVSTYNLLNHAYCRTFFTVNTNASYKQLGAVIGQNNKPIDFLLGILTNPQCRIFYQRDNNLTPEEPQLYQVSSPKMSGSAEFPIEGCRGRSTSCTNLRIHFVHCHVRYMPVSMEEYNRPPNLPPQLINVHYLIRYQQTTPQQRPL